uniref:Dynein heavy chain hydrolytic ATP-binding dynein motor region domain-containing protein n=1 Tax=Ditylenchus dipsaci TaxID=166011 RepID=A0A915D6Y0_9BILA
MTQPDRKLIAEVMLFSQGFQTAETLAKKMCHCSRCVKSSSPINTITTSRAEIQRISKDQHDKGTKSQERDIASRLPEQQF